MIRKSKVQDDHFEAMKIDVHVCNSNLGFTSCIPSGLVLKSTANHNTSIMFLLDRKKVVCCSQSVIHQFLGYGKKWAIFADDNPESRGFSPPGGLGREPAIALFMKKYQIGIVCQP